MILRISSGSVIETFLPSNCVIVKSSGLFPALKTSSSRTLVSAAVLAFRSTPPCAYRALAISSLPSMHAEMKGVSPDAPCIRF